MKTDAVNARRLILVPFQTPPPAVTLQFQHNVVGRRVYAEGTVDAALFLASKIEEGADKKIYNMVDVLSGGSMR